MKERKNLSPSCLNVCVNVCVQGVVLRKTRFQSSEKTQSLFVCLPPGLHTHTLSVGTPLYVPRQHFLRGGLNVFSKKI